ncbi:hypothetical protein [Serinibacter salmoneus]|uniref:Uncharacterized protein n=1 Tax=Serinibacter salmoneus TaxID=556530 RepID=A0A2A9D0G5_9MICO|nr:hypothetical protein [Serinibacter salmoneus]PFG19876.1 hypothetical protein ATL40_1452 [Serinibacter salmoneus]
MLQTYSPRDPVAEAMVGEITPRQLRVMIEHLPPGNAWQRAAYGPWGDSERLQADTSNRLRDMLLLQSRQLSLVAGALKVNSLQVGKPEYITPPEPVGAKDVVRADLDRAYEEQVAAELDAVMHRE